MWARSRGRVCVVPALLTLALAFAAVATADGDPASDFLAQQDSFVPYPPPPSRAVDTLTSAVGAVWARDDRIKVAVIASRQDLGSVTSLFDHPADYARFLATELSFLYHGPLLVTMPNGYGFVRNAVPSAAGQSVVDRLPNGNDAASLTTAATSAVRALEQAGLLHVRDTQVPTITPRSLRAIRGRRIFLSYSAVDDSEYARVDLTVRTPQGRTLTSFAIPFKRAVPTMTSGIVWRVPRTAPASLLLCGRATDRAGNRSALACAALSVH